GGGGRGGAPEPEREGGGGQTVDERRRRDPRREPADEGDALAREEQAVVARGEGAEEAHRGNESVDTPGARAKRATSQGVGPFRVPCGNASRPDRVNPG